MIYKQELIFECIPPLDIPHIHSTPLIAIIIYIKTPLLYITNLMGLCCIKSSFHLTLTKVVPNNNEGAINCSNYTRLTKLCNQLYMNAYCKQ